jgi:hypothetical protein
MSGSGKRVEGFDGAAAVTRSLLGYGVVAGVLYLGVGLVLALTRDGFDLAAHPLSVLSLGERGWMQRANFAVTGLMTIAAAGWLAARGLEGWAGRSRVAAALIVVGFVGGAVASGAATGATGVVLLWIAVLVGWGWLAAASVTVYRTVPHPDADRRAGG